MQTNTSKKKWLCLILFFNCLIVVSQELKFKTLTVKNGLSQHDASCVFQDSYGFIWIGTYDGLNRFDGYKVLNYFNETDNLESISSNRITFLFEDSNKRLWIGTDGGGLNYYSLKTEKFTRIETPKKYEHINNITENGNGDLLIATGNGLLKIVNNENLIPSIIQSPLTGLNVNYILNANQNQTYFATSSGIWVLINEDYFQLKSFGNKNYFQLFEDKNCNIWATGGDTGFESIIFEPNTNKIIQSSEIGAFNIRSVCKSNNGNIWLGTIGDGLLEIDINSYRIINKIKSGSIDERSLLSNNVMSLFLDNSNTLWVSNRKGICYSNLNQKKINEIFLSKRSHISLRPHIRNLFIEDNNILLSIQGENSFQYSFETKELHKLLFKDKQEVLCFNKINENIYTGTINGVFINDEEKTLFKKKNFKNTNYIIEPRIVNSISYDKYGNIYYGAEQGLLIERENKAFWIHNEYDQTENLKDIKFWCLFYDPDENCMWMGSKTKGIFKMNLTELGHFKSLENFNNNMKDNYHISNNNIWSFYKDSKKKLWVGTDAGLFVKNSESQKFVPIKINGLKDKKIMAIEGDKLGNLWLSNSQGLIFYNPTKNKTSSFTYEDGLNSNTLTEASGKTEDGLLVFGGISGINFFNPLELVADSTEANIVISDFKVHNISIKPGNIYFGEKILDKSINLTKKIKLNYRQNDFLFEFMSSNFSNSTQNSFKYKLEGYDKKWNYTNSKYRFATYSNLSAGTYNFKFNAANQDGIWSNNIKNIEIEILPQPWFSFWAYLAYLIVGVSITFTLIYFSRNRQELKHRLELSKVQLEKEHNINELKLMFFADVAHEFKTPLSLIIGPVDELINGNLSISQKDFCLNIVSRNTKRMTNLISQFLDFRKINSEKNILKVSESDLVEFVNSIVKSFEWEANNQKIKINQIRTSSFCCFFDQDIIEKVIYNLLSNALKYTPDGGIIEIEVKQIWKKNRKIANIIIRDSGEGIPIELRDKIFERYFHGKERSSSGIGLHLNYNLIQAHKGEINVSESNFGGTEFIVSIPVSRDDYDEFELCESLKLPILDQNFGITNVITDQDIKQHNESILVIEDDHDLRQYLKNTLQNKYVVLEAKNGLNGIEIATKNIPDLIITDVMMPKMDGLEMCNILKSNIETSHIPILMITAKTAEKHQIEALEAGAWDFICKPFNTQSLKQKINNILETRGKFKDFLILNDISTKKKYTPYDQKLIASVNKIIDNNINSCEFSVGNLAINVGLSRMQLHRKLKTLTGLTSTQFINRQKILHATKMFDEGCDRINEAMDAVGINSYSHFNKLFKSINSLTASDYIAAKIIEKNITKISPKAKKSENS